MMVLFWTGGTVRIFLVFFYWGKGERDEKCKRGIFDIFKSWVGASNIINVRRIFV